jgi:hypothetical protein
MLRHEHEALLQGAVDGTLTPEERDALRQLLARNADARERVGELGRLNALLASLGTAEAPPTLVTDVLARVRPHAAAPQPIRKFVRSIPKRGEIVNKKLIVGLAAAAAVILAVITYTSFPPATEGTEATIGAAQRAQTPQIASKDVGLGDTSAQDVLQSDTWDAIMKDEDLRSTLQDAEVRRMLEDAELRLALESAEVRRFLNDPNVARRMADRDLIRQINDAEAVKKLNEAALRNGAFLRYARNPMFRDVLSRPGAARALGGEAMGRFLRDARAGAALRSARFEQALRSGSQTR